jgi:hypothetical protein
VLLRAVWEDLELIAVAAPHLWLRPRLRPEHFYAGEACSDVSRPLRSGVTTVCEAQFFESDLDMRPSRRFGRSRIRCVRGVFARTIMDRGEIRTGLHEGKPEQAFSTDRELLINTKIDTV